MLSAPQPASRSPDVKQPFGFVILAAVIIVLLAATVLFAPMPAHAQLALLGVGAKSSGSPPPPPGYTGPGDIKTYAIWGGLYAYSGATRGTKAVNICNVSDVACADVNSDATTGIVPDPTIGGVLCGTTVGVNVCTIKTFYDQSGNSNDLSETTIAWRALFVPNCAALGTGISCARFAGSGTQGYGPTASVNWTHWTVSFVGKRTGNFSAENDVISNNTGTQVKASFYTSNLIVILGGTAAFQAATDSAWHVVQGVNDTGNLTAVDSTVVSQTVGPRAFDDAIFIGDTCISCGNPFTGDLVSYGVATTNFSSGDLGSINSNAHTILGF
jgi:hypothetical protein